MQQITPRLHQILHILLNNGNVPVSVKEIGALLGVSRRTVFRELEYTDAVLKKHNLAINTVLGRGIALTGSEESKNQLKDYLSGSSLEPANRKQRQERLTLHLLLSESPEKLYYYASLLTVSESTISNDLDIIEDWLKSYQVVLTRKSGQVIKVVGEEFAIRRACVSILKTMEDLLLAPLHKSIILKLPDFLAGLEGMCSWMTPESVTEIKCYVVILLQRFVNGREIGPIKESMDFLVKALEISKEIEETFDIILTSKEKAALSVELSACRNNTLDIPESTEKDTKLLNLSYRLIEAYDPVYAPMLKMDDSLLNGLVFHLKSALIRIENRIEILDPLLNEIMERYPDVMVKSRKAAKLIAKDDWLPESEISFLAIHFGGAIHRLRSHNIMVYNLQIGVFCQYGIGTSYILATNIRKHFEGEAEIKVCERDEIEGENEFDLIISTVPLDNVNTPVIIVPPFPKDEDILRIRDAISRLEMALESKVVGALHQDNNHFAEISNLSFTMSNLLEYFDAIKIESNCSFETLVKQVGYRFGENRQSGKMIYESLILREKLATQVIPELKIVLLHCKTAGVNVPKLALFIPEDGQFTNPYFKGARSCVLMLVPLKLSKRSAELMGIISSTLIENPIFLNAIWKNDKMQILAILKTIFNRFLIHEIKKGGKLNGII